MAMLRITTIDENNTTATLKVEGRIVSDWIGTLERVCHGWLERGKTIYLDLSGVTFIDTQGVASVRTLVTRNVRITGCSDLIQSLLYEEDAP